MGINSDAAQNTLTTTDDTTTSAVSYSFPANASAIVQVRTIGVDQSQNTIGIESRVIVSRTNGNCSMIGAGEKNIIKESDSPLSGTGSALSVNGSSLQVNVTGLIDTEIRWAVRLDVLYLN